MTTSLEFISEQQFFSISQLEDMTKARKLNVIVCLTQFQWLQSFPTNIITPIIDGLKDSTSLDQRKYNYLDVFLLSDSLTILTAFP